MRIPEDHF